MKKERREAPVHVLVVDDSAVVRQFMSSLLEQQPMMTVSVAADPYIAMAKMEHKRPDVIVLDLEMPRMDGLTFLKRIMAEHPIPVVVCSGHALKGTEAALRALDHGAVEVIGKPQLGVREFLEDSSLVLVDTIRAAAASRIRRKPHDRGVEPRHTADVVLSPRPARPPQAGRETVVAIGASTGGTEALRDVLERMPADAPAMVIVQHMPESFTAAFASRLDRNCRMSVKEAADGDRVRPGEALIAPGNRHILVIPSGPHHVVRVTDGPLVSRHRPSVDVLFRSVAQTIGSGAVGVIMTGMGDDGAQGMEELKAAGARTIAQDEATSVVFGMPRAAIQRGAVDVVVPLSGMAAAILAKAEFPAPPAGGRGLGADVAGERAAATPQDGR